MGKMPKGLNEWMLYFLSDYTESLEGLAKNIFEYDGPPRATINGRAYELLSHNGLHTGGGSFRPNDEPRCWTKAEARFRFAQQLRDIILERRPEEWAWRVRPEMNFQPSEGYWVRARFATFGDQWAEDAEAAAA